MGRISAIICVYNEEKTLKEVVLAVANSKTVCEIIIVNDGSSDNTRNIIDELKKNIEITVIHFEENKGKGHAMAIGVENAKSELIAFIDADQTKITSGYIDQMLNILSNTNCDMVLGYTTIRLLNLNINPLKVLTGERVLYKKDIIPILDKMKESRFGVETLLYLYYESMNKSIKYTKLVGLRHKDKYKKVSVVEATIRYIKEGWEILYTALINYNLMFKAIVIKTKPE
jgi:glycosyltransferase involved in cell wall biosynthesis